MTSEQACWQRPGWGFADDFTNLTLVVDGHAVSNLDRLRVQAESTFTSVDNNVFGIPAATDSKFAADGYWALIKLTPGEHTITFGGSYPPGDFTTLVTYDLFVKNRIPDDRLTSSLIRHKAAGHRWHIPPIAR